MCTLSSKLVSVPYAVSLVQEKCQLANNVLKVINNLADADPVLNFTVCVTPFNFNYNQIHQLTEFIEINRMFGAQKFVFYNYTTGIDVDRYLHAYIRKGLVVVIPWRVPVAVDIWPPDPKEEPDIHYFAQLASLNDCLYRNMFKSRFIVFSDLDEIIVPRNASTWLDMLASVTADWQHSLNSENKNVFPGAYLIQNVFFFNDWPIDETLFRNVKVQYPSLVTLLKTRREKVPHIWYSRSKYIAWSRMTLMVSVHSVIDFIDNSKVMHVMVSEKSALLHHYRDSIDSHSLESKSTIDRRMHVFFKEIVNRITSAHNMIQ